MSPNDISKELAQSLPYLRRYARALTGSQSTGDKYALATMEALIHDPDAVHAETARIDLFRAFHKIWSSSGTPVADFDIGLNALEEGARKRLSALMPNTREALLLNVVEGFASTEVAKIMETSVEEAEHLIQRAFDDMQEMVKGDVLVIEDEAVIAMDLEDIVSSMGHSVTGVARTASAAVQLGQRKVPDLILADIQLADGSSGIDAVKDLLAKLGDRPVIFITAFPERLLTGERPEPAFLITKPYSEDQVRTAISQAMFFATTEDLSVS